jgi:zinc transporter
MIANMPEGRAAVANTRSQARAHMLPGLVWAFRFYADGAPEEVAVDQPIADHLDGWLWLHFDSADSDVSQFLESKIPSPAVELLITTDDHQQLHADDACVYGVFADLVCALGSPAKEIGFLHFAMTERLLVTNRRNALDAVEATREAVRKGRKIATAAALLGTIVEHVADAVDAYAEDLAGNLDDIEERILSDETSDERLTLGQIRRTTVRLHRQLAISRSLINCIECISEPSIPLQLPTEKLGSASNG